MSGNERAAVIVAVVMCLFGAIGIGFVAWVEVETARAKVPAPCEVKP